MIRLGRTKTTSADDEAKVLLVGAPVAVLKEWLPSWSGVEARALTPQSINLILKRRRAAAGLDPAGFSAHGLRSG